MARTTGTSDAASRPDRSFVAERAEAIRASYRPSEVTTSEFRGFESLSAADTVSAHDRLPSPGLDARGRAAPQAVRVAQPVPDLRQRRHADWRRRAGPAVDPQLVGPYRDRPRPGAARDARCSGRGRHSRPHHPQAVVLDAA